MKHKIFILSLALGIFYDILFWNKSQGISFFIFILIVLTFANIVLSETIQTKSKFGFLFLLPIGFFSVMSFLFTEPFISFLNRAITLLLVGIWAAGYESGNWMRFGLVDYLVSGFRLAFNFVSFPWLRSKNLGLFPMQEEKKSSRVIPVLRGLALTLPILVIFSFLFASADMVFADNLEKLLDIFDINNLGEYLKRLLVVFLFANFFLGLIVFAINNKNKLHYAGEDKPFLDPFLGTIESVMVLSSVLLLFTSFIALQFRYFFFNQSAITELGYTYSEYARRGFGELIAVSVINMALILVFNTITKILTPKDNQILSWLNTGLVLANLIILISAFLRLNLYETAFGFTRLRMYSHVFIIWLGILLIVTNALAWKNNLRQFANVFFLFVIGFIATLNLANTDVLIVNQNIQRSISRENLDSTYLGGLSSDSVPALVSHFQDETLAAPFRLDLGAAILCFQITNEEQLMNDSWQSFSISRYRANRLLKSIASDIQIYEIKENDGINIVVDSDGKETICTSELFFD